MRFLWAFRYNPIARAQRLTYTVKPSPQKLLRNFCDRQVMRNLLMQIAHNGFHARGRPKNAASQAPPRRNTCKKATDAFLDGT
jgi:hypothetical protein